MIKSITGQGSVIVAGANGSSPYIDMSRPSAGMLRYNGNAMEVYDGSSWVIMAPEYATVSLNGNAESLLQWAEAERAKQRAREELIAKNPALQKAYEAIKKAEANFDILAKFVENDSVTGVNHV